MLCGARTRAGTPCQKQALAGKTRCRNHGACSLAGPNHPNWRHGRRSKEVIARHKAARERLRELIYIGRLIGLFNE